MIAGGPAVDTIRLTDESSAPKGVDPQYHGLNRSRRSSCSLCCRGRPPRRRSGRMRLAQSGIQPGCVRKSELGLSLSTPPEKHTESVPETVCFRGRSGGITSLRRGSMPLAIEPRPPASGVYSVLQIQRTTLTASGGSQIAKARSRIPSVNTAGRTPSGFSASRRQRASAKFAEIHCASRPRCKRRFGVPFDYLIGEWH